VAGLPTPDEIEGFLAAIRRDRQFLRDLAGADPSLPDVAAMVDQIGERLLVADEELRVQNEHLTQNARRLDLLVALHEELFDNAPTAYLQTDDDGRLLRINAATRRLLGRDLARRHPPTVTILMLVRQQDRPAVRALMSRMRAGEKSSVKPAEVALVRADGTEVPVVVTVRRSESAGSGHPLLHWELAEVAVRDPQTDYAVDALRRIAQAAQQLASQETRAMTLEQVVEQALNALPSADGVGVTLVRARGRVETPVASGQLASTCDRLQYDLHEGPCLDAVRTGLSIRVEDMRTDARWPRYAPRAADCGVGSMLVLPLVTPRGRTGALNVYARASGAFDEEDDLIGHAYATHAAIALMHVDLETNLRTGLATRQEIGQAVGILMERHRLSAATAFDLLVQASQQAHLKLRDIAARVVETGEDPTTFV
jgi:PAS domain S-box-containing protein